MLVIARKFNDVFYAMSTDEWSQVETHHLLIISGYLTKKDFPFVDAFDKVYVINGSTGSASVIYELYKVFLLFRGKSYRYVTTCNLAHISHLFLLKLLNEVRTILLEDGLMNYFSFRTSQRLTKRVVKFLLGVDENRLLRKVYKTYILNPEDAIYYYGYPTRLNIDFSCFMNRLHFDIPINNKRIFAGQPFYLDGSMTIEEYSEIVNKIIEKFKIDYYLPHRTSSSSENIKCVLLDLSKYKVTLEVLASSFQFDVYGFSSSLLYSTKLINSNIHSFAIQQYGKVSKDASKYILDHVDAIFSL